MWELNGVKAGLSFGLEPLRFGIQKEEREAGGSVGVGAEFVSWHFYGKAMMSPCEWWFSH